MSKASERVVVCVRPRGVGPSWWPVARKERLVDNLEAVPFGADIPHIGLGLVYQWNTITDTGGFTNGFDPSCAVEGDQAVGELVDEWFQAHEDDPWPWEIRAVVLTD